MFNLINFVAFCKYTLIQNLMPKKLRQWQQISGSGTLEDRMQMLEWVSIKRQIKQRYRIERETAKSRTARGQLMCRCVLLKVCGCVFNFNQKSGDSAWGRKSALLSVHVLLGNGVHFTVRAHFRFRVHVSVLCIDWRQVFNWSVVCVGECRWLRHGGVCCECIRCRGKRWRWSGYSSGHDNKRLGKLWNYLNTFRTF